MNTLERIRASYPILARALEDMFWKVAGHRRFAKTLARRAGLKSGTGDVGPQTIIAGYVHPFEEPHARTYATDLTAAERVALSAQTLMPLYVLAKFSTSPSLFVLQAPDGTPVSASAGSPSGWVTLADFMQSELTLTLSVDPASVQISAEALGGSFEVLLEAD